MTAEARQWKNILRWSTNGNFFQTLAQQWAFSPRDISCYLIPGFTSSAARLVHNNTISKDVCRVLYCDVSPPPILPVLSRFIEFACHMRLYSRTIIYSSFIHTSHIHSYIHTIIHSYINTFTHLCIHNIYMHGCINHPKSCLVVSFRFSLQIVSSCQS